MISLGPIIFGFILGLIVGSQIKLADSDVNLTAASFVVIFIAGIFMAWPLGNFPFYTDWPVSTAFLAGMIGIFVGMLFARSK